MVGNPWTWSENKLFEVELAELTDFTWDACDKIAEKLGTKSAVEVKAQYDKLIEDLVEIDEGRVPLPEYPDDMAELSPSPASAELISSWPQFPTQFPEKQRPVYYVHWTEEEHKLFLEVLSKYGKGNWINIASHFVKTKTAEQVKSHARGYFNRQNVEKKKRKKPSINDITTVDGLTTSPLPADQNLSSPTMSTLPPQDYPSDRNEALQHDPPTSTLPGDEGSSFTEHQSNKDPK